jgi:DnaJ homologue, subfamily C, member 28, conserved domain
MKIASFPDSQSTIRILKSAIKPMLPGFNKIVEERIRVAQKKGQFKNLAGSGKPLALEDDSHIAEELRLAYKILKNADCLPPEVELKKEIARTEELLGGLEDTAEKYRTLKKLNYLIMKLNSLRNTSIGLEVPQQYSAKLVERLEATKNDKK